ncbi:cuticle protein 10.9-like protein [Leptotrombidium deliense]|uniref:Cuticle protein 10.9-like protein n=1 Tax=Leptotrombidium deliense TaxID=299467 RepID=A0A443SSV6_9ACAR|nr:cuticle protein 10.9-like protein [Leptotrombidium deliense]
MPMPFFGGDQAQTANSDVPWWISTGARAVGSIAGISVNCQLRAGVEEREPAPEPYAFAFSSDTEDGALSTREETGDANGRVVGFYTIDLPDGSKRRVDYEADEYGYRARIATNEIGTESRSPADIEMESSAPTAADLVAKYGASYSRSTSSSSSSSSSGGSGIRLIGGGGGGGETITTTRRVTGSGGSGIALIGGGGGGSTTTTTRRVTGAGGSGIRIIGGGGSGGSTTTTTTTTRRVTGADGSVRIITTGEGGSAGRTETVTSRRVSGGSSNFVISPPSPSRSTSTTTTTTRRGDDGIEYVVVPVRRGSTLREAVDALGLPSDTNSAVILDRDEAQAIMTRHAKN